MHPHQTTLLNIQPGESFRLPNKTQVYKAGALKIDKSSKKLKYIREYKATEAQHLPYHKSADVVVVKVEVNK